VDLVFDKAQERLEEKGRTGVQCRFRHVKKLRVGRACLSRDPKRRKFSS